MEDHKNLTRRDFLKLLALFVSSSVISSCEVKIITPATATFTPTEKLISPNTSTPVSTKIENELYMDTIDADSSGFFNHMAIVTDSTSNIPPLLVKGFDIKVAPQNVILNIDGIDRVFKDGIDITSDDFFRYLETGKSIPMTSQVDVESFVNIFEPLVSRGIPILAILVSEKLSATISSANIAKSSFPNAEIRVINSQSTGMGLGFQVLAAARAAARGKSFSKVFTLCHEMINYTGTVFVVETLEFLHRGGRIGGATRYRGTALNMTPILHLLDGKVEPIERLRTKNKALSRIIDILGEQIDNRTSVRIAILHFKAKKDANMLMQEVIKRFNPIELILMEITPSVGCHVGPGTIALCYSMDPGN
jgi:DegV family protein with EDD domain